MNTTLTIMKVIHFKEAEMTIKEIRSMTGLKQDDFAKKYGLPIGTLHHWEAGDRKPPEYVLRLLERVVREDYDG